MFLHHNWTMNEPKKLEQWQNEHHYTTAERSITRIYILRRSQRAAWQQPSIDTAERDYIAQRCVYRVEKNAISHPSDSAR